MALIRQRLPQAMYMPSPTEAQMLNSVEEWYNTNNYSVRLDTCINGYGVVFDNLNGKNLQYTIRPAHEVLGEDDDSTWNTDDTQPRFQVPGPRVSPKYIIKVQNFSQKIISLM